MHAERLLYSICVRSLLLIAQAIFLLESGHTERRTDRQTDATERLTQAGGYASMGNDNKKYKSNNTLIINHFHCLTA